MNKFYKYLIHLEIWIWNFIQTIINRSFHHTTYAIHQKKLFKSNCFRLITNLQILISQTTISKNPTQNLNLFKKHIKIYFFFKPKTYKSRSVNQKYKNRSAPPKNPTQNRTSTTTRTQSKPSNAHQSLTLDPRMSRHKSSLICRHIALYSRVWHGMEISRTRSHIDFDEAMLYIFIKFRNTRTTVH